MRDEQLLINSMTPPRKRFVLVPWFVFGSLMVCTNALILQCPPCEYVTCPPLECTNSTSHTYFDECGCCILCGKAEGERCGGESNAGGNCVPGLSCNYRTGIVLGDERMGQCEPEDCYRHVCGYRERCSTNFFGTTDCRCSHHRCSGKSNVVCGNDGITYASVCHLQSAECSSSKFIGIHHFGMCCSSSSQPVTTSPPPATTASRNSIPGDDDLFGQLLIHTEPPEAASEAPKRCLYKNQVYNANNELIKINECLYRICNYEGILREILVPGCPGGPVEPDYGVDKYPVDGGWSSWSSWSECEGSCLNSTHYRTRTCTNPSPMYEGRNCSGDAMETQRCIPAICELSCNYSTWSPWSACSVTCGKGTQTRTRDLLTDVFDEAVCRLEDVRVCSRPKCKMYNCRRRSTLKFFVNERGCRSIKMFKDYYCSGACRGSDENCCRATRYYLHRYIPMQCEGDHSYRDHDFPNQISECSCAACEEESGEGINLGEQGS